MFLFSNKLDLNQETRFTIVAKHTILFLNNISHKGKSYIGLLQYVSHAWYICVH